MTGDEIRDRLAAADRIHADHAYYTLAVETAAESIESDEDLIPAVHALSTLLGLPVRVDLLAELGEAIEFRERGEDAHDIAFWQARVDGLVRTILAGPVLPRVAVTR